MAEAEVLSSEVARQEVDFVIVTALGEERDAVLDKLPGCRKLPPSEDDVCVYYWSDLLTTFADGSTGIYHVVVMPLLRMGRVEAATATTDAIRQWYPRYVILVGIAGGVAANGVKLGDVLVPDKIVDYELQKQTAKGADIRWEVYNTSPRLLGAAENFMDEGWLNLITVKRPYRGQPKRHIGPIASGDKVVDFAKTLKKYRETWSKLVGVEMEAGGVAASAFRAAKHTEFFVIRGVSDLADGDKNAPRVKKWRPYACDVAAAYAVVLLKSGPVPLCPSRDDGKSRSSQEMGGPDGRILISLHTYFEKYPGIPKMSFVELTKSVGSERNTMIRSLRGLEEKGWLGFQLLKSGKAGEVWLTESGFDVARSLLEN